MEPNILLENDLMDIAEAAVVRARGPLTKTTTPKEWAAYWDAVDAEYQRIVGKETEK